MKRHWQRGVTLIELVVAIVVIGVAVSSVLAMLAYQASHSGSAMIQSQAEHIATAYLNEVIQKPFAPQANAGGRANFNDVSDYNGLVNNGARDQSNALIAGLGSFTVRVNVTQAALGPVPASESKRVDVTVTHPIGISVVMTGFRTQYP
jgi:MSHA pilin protein MshD